MNTFFSTLLRVTRDCGHIVLALGARLVRWLPTASWQRLLAVCLLVAIMLAVVPLALTLFLVFLLLKLVLAAFAVPADRNKTLQLHGPAGDKDAP